MRNRTSVGTEQILNKISDIPTLPQNVSFMIPRAEIFIRYPPFCLSKCHAHPHGEKTIFQ